MNLVGFHAVRSIQRSFSNPARAARRHAVRPSHPRTGFTLLELLIVIGVIALLLSIILGAIRKARESSDMGACLANLRQIGSGINVYVADNNGLMPMALERWVGNPTLPNLTGGGRGRTWAGLLLDSSSVRMVAFRCPADDRIYDLTRTNFYLVTPAESMNALVGNDPRFLFSYAANYMAHGVLNLRPPWTMPSPGSTPQGAVGAFRRTGIPKPSKMQLVWDGHFSIMTSSNGMAALISAVDSQWASGGYLRETIFRHGVSRDSGPNTLFADGHAEAKVQFFKLTDADCTVTR